MLTIATRRAALTLARQTLRPQSQILAQNAFRAAGTQGVRSFASSVSNNMNTMRVAENLKESTKINIMPEGATASFSGHDFRALDLLRAARSPPMSSAQTKVATNGLVFEFSVAWVLGALQNAVLGLGRNLLYTYRPLVMLFIMGNLMKVAFFLCGAPMLISFYSVWLFETAYNLLQCALSFIFVNMYYNDMACNGSMYKARMQEGFRRALMKVKNLRL